MLARSILTAIVLLGVAAFGAGLFAVSHGSAEALASDPAYYLVIQHDQSATSFSQTTVVSTGQSSVSVAQFGGSSSVACTRFSTLDEAQAAAADRYPGETVQAVLAVDAMHALAQAANISDDLMAMLPQLDDAAVCTA